MLVACSGGGGLLIRDQGGGLFIRGRGGGLFIRGRGGGLFIRDQGLKKKTPAENINPHYCCAQLFTLQKFNSISTTKNINNKNYP